MTCGYGCERTRQREQRRVVEEHCHRKIEKGTQCFVHLLASARESGVEAGDSRPYWVDIAPRPSGAVSIGRKQGEEMLERTAGAPEKPRVDSETGTGLATRATACAYGNN